MKMKDLREFFKRNSKEHYQAIKINCVVCGHETPHKIIHKESGNRYPLCLECRSKGFYNKEIFDVWNYREQIK